MTTRAIVVDAYGASYDVLSVQALPIEPCAAMGDIITRLRRLKRREYSSLCGQ